MPVRQRALTRSTLAVAVVAAGLIVGTAAPLADAHRSSWTWSYSVLVDRIAGAPVRFHERRFRISRDLVICSGEGSGVRRGSIRRWRHFICTQTLFRHGIDQDVTFRVHVLGRTRYVVTDVQYGTE
jgi:hypothetical protein